MEKLKENKKPKEKISYTSCRYCKNEIRLNIRRCPYCGTLNPTVKPKEIIITSFVIIVLFYIGTYILK